MALQTEIKQGVGVVTVTGSLNATVAESVRSQVCAWLQGQPDLKQVVVDLEGVTFLDSTGLGLLIGLFKRLAERGGEVKLARPQPAVRTVLDITRVNKIFEVLPRLEDAWRPAG